MTTTDDLERLAANALRKIARDEHLKAHIESDPVLRPILLRAARRYLGGTTRAECLDTVGSLLSAGHAVSVELMGENTRDAGSADHETEEFLGLATDLGRFERDTALALDLSHIGLAIDASLALANARRVADAAAAIGNKLIISMEGSERTDAILDTYRILCAERANLGITVQARLHRTPRDLDALLALPGKVRLVKGAYEEPEAIALGRDSAELFDRYRELALRLIRSGRPVAIATHDARILDAIHAELLASPPPDPTSFEFEVLVGLGDDVIDRMRSRGYRTRVYAVYGREWYLYVCHRIAEQPRRLFQALVDVIGSDATEADAASKGRSALFPHR